MLSVKATTHQGNSKYFGAGKQCVANSYAAMLYSKTVQPKDWSTEDLDIILENGSNLYKEIGLNSTLLITELPELYNNYKLNTVKSCAGPVYENDLTEAPFTCIRESLGEIQSFSFLTIKSSTVAIMKAANQYYIFDPHSRCCDGMLKPDGTAVLTVYTNCDELVEFTEKLCSSLGGSGQVVPYEMTHITITDTDIVSDSENDFEGFSDISDGEYSCILYIAQQGLKEKVHKIEEDVLKIILSDSESDSDSSVISFIDDCKTDQYSFPLSDTDSDNIPLARLAQICKPNQVPESDSDRFSDADILSSGSEYHFTAYDRRLIEESLSESDSGSSVKESSTLNRKKKCKSKKKPVKKKMKVKNANPVYVDRNGVVFVSEISGEPTEFVGVTGNIGGEVNNPDIKVTDFRGGAGKICGEMGDLSDEVVNLYAGDGNFCSGEGEPGIRVGDLGGRVSDLSDGVDNLYAGNGNFYLGESEPGIKVGDLGGRVSDLGDGVDNLYAGNGNFYLGESEPGIRVGDLGGRVSGLSDKVDNLYAGNGNFYPGESEPGIRVSDLGGRVSDLSDGVDNLYAGNGNFCPGEGEPGISVGVGNLNAGDSNLYDLVNDIGVTMVDLGAGLGNLNTSVGNICVGVGELGDTAESELSGGVGNLNTGGSNPCVGVGELGVTAGEFVGRMGGLNCEIGNLATGDSTLCAEASDGLCDLDGGFNEHDGGTDNPFCLVKDIEGGISGFGKGVDVLGGGVGDIDVIESGEIRSRRVEQCVGGEGEPCNVNETGDATPLVNMNRDIDSTYRGRKRVRQPENWKRNVRKRLCNSGSHYVNHHGKEVRAKAVKKGCGQKCRFKCHEKFDKVKRENIFHTYYNLDNINQKRQFLIKFSSPKPKASKRMHAVTSKKYSFVWSLPDKNGCNVRVCKTFFLDTLDISGQMIQTALKKSSTVPGVCENDKRGTHNCRPNRTSDDIVQNVTEHINSFPRVESHYCRKDSKKEYLEQDLNLMEMYRKYISKCEKENLSPASLAVYRSIFDHKFNIGFAKPLKDQCDVCTRFKNATQLEKEKLSDNYKIHLINKDEARKQKETDKANVLSGNDQTLTAACFDLEKVLMTPKGETSALFYRRRLNTFNLSIYDLGTSNAHCYVWNESIAGRGACEIGSCIYDFLKLLSENGKQKIIFYSDNCSSQNKNRFYVAMLWYSMITMNLKSITHKYPQKGHTQSENDSVHAAVETASAQSKDIYTTPQWAATIRAARKPKIPNLKSKSPYVVKEMDTTDFYDFKTLARALKNFDRDEDNEKVRWTDIVMFSLSNDNPNVVSIYYDYNGEVHYLNLVQRVRRSTEIPNPMNMVLQKLYEDRPKISWEKYRDLLWLCKTGLIPKVHHLYFFMLPHYTE